MSLVAAGLHKGPFSTEAVCIGSEEFTREGEQPAGPGGVYKLHLNRFQPECDSFRHPMGSRMPARGLTPLRPRRQEGQAFRSPLGRSRRNNKQLRGDPLAWRVCGRSQGSTIEGSSLA